MVFACTVSRVVGIDSLLHIAFTKAVVSYKGGAFLKYEGIPDVCQSYTVDAHKLRFLGKLPGGHSRSIK